MTSNFKKGNYVVYGRNGLCVVQDLQPLSFGKSAPKNYYILEPVGEKKSLIYIPADSVALVDKMRSVMTKDEIDDILFNAKGLSLDWIEDRNLRQNTFSKIINSGNYKDFILLINCLYEKKLEREEQGKKLPSNDEAILNSTEKLIEEEFSFALNIDPQEIGAYIKSKLNNSLESKVS